MAEHQEIKTFPREVTVTSCDRCGERISEGAQHDAFRNARTTGSEIIAYRNDPRRTFWVICDVCTDQLDRWMNGRVVSEPSGS